MVKNTYTYAVGRRKTSTATIKLFASGTGEFNIVKGEKKIDIKTFFGGHKYLYEDALYPLYIMGNDSVIKYNAEIIITGGGLRGQAEAIRLAFSRALSDGLPEIRTQLKPYGLLKRDPRRKERKKPGLKGARRAPQWSKR